MVSSQTDFWEGCNVYGIVDSNRDVDFRKF
jgi:hypothetical protein